MVGLTVSMVVGLVDKFTSEVVYIRNFQVFSVDLLCSLSCQNQQVLAC